MQVKTLFGLVLVFVLFACGTVRMDLDTKVRDLEDFSHEFEITYSGQLALMMEDDVFSPSWDIKSEGDTTSFKFSHRFKGDEAKEYLSGSSEFLEFFEDDPLNSFSLTSTDTPDGTIYRASYSFNDFSDATEDADTESIIDLDEMLRGMFLFKWTVEMPGEIVNSNSDSVTESTANFAIDGVEVQDLNELWVESLVKPSSLVGFFGSPGIPWDSPTISRWLLVTVGAVTGGLMLWFVLNLCKSRRIRLYQSPLDSVSLVGATGVVSSDLSPSGEVLVNGEFWSGEAELGTARTISAGANIEVVSVAGNHLKVKPVQNDSSLSDVSDNE